MRNANPTPMVDALEELREIMERYTVRCTPQEFHAAVNLAFHRHESQVYDEVHRNMWQSLPLQFELLTQDCLSHATRPARVALDVGCGTGLSSELLLRTALGKQIREIHLLDSSPEMLERAVARSSSWGITTKVIHGVIDDVHKGPYDLVLTCSVLHHIPDLRRFLQSVRNLQTNGSSFLHLQDPNGDYLTDSELRQRSHHFAALTRKRLPGWIRRLAPKRVTSRIWRGLSGAAPHDYIALTNHELMESGMIASPMVPGDIWRVTDIYDREDVGISMNELRGLLPDHQPVSRRSYGFFGVLESDLPEHLREAERKLISERAQSGHYVGGSWSLA